MKKDPLFIGKHPVVFRKFTKQFLEAKTMTTDQVYESGHLNSQFNKDFNAIPTTVVLTQKKVKGKHNGTDTATVYTTNTKSNTTNSNGFASVVKQTEELINLTDIILKIKCKIIVEEGSKRWLPQHTRKINKRN